MITSINMYLLLKKLITAENELNDGLILTHDIHDSLDAILKFTSINDIDMADETIIDNKIHITTSKLNMITLTKLLTLFNNLGYYIAEIVAYKPFRNKLLPKTYKFDDFKFHHFNEISLNSIVQYDFELEPKFDTKHKLKSNILYHVTEDRYLDRVLKYGLMTKSKNTLKTYPERIYFTYNIEDSKTYISTKTSYYRRNDLEIFDKENPKNNYNKVKFIILKINIPDSDNIIFYDDPNFKDNGLYTYDSINPKYIEIT